MHLYYHRKAENESKFGKKLTKMLRKEIDAKACEEGVGQPVPLKQGGSPKKSSSLTERVRIDESLAS